VSVGARRPFDEIGADADGSSSVTTRLRPFSFAS
jgi:hypothetical protein